MHHSFTATALASTAILAWLNQHQQKRCLISATDWKCRLCKRLPTKVWEELGHWGRIQGQGLNAKQRKRVRWSVSTCSKGTGCDLAPRAKQSTEDAHGRLLPINFQTYLVAITTLLPLLQQIKPRNGHTNPAWQVVTGKARCRAWRSFLSSHWWYAQVQDVSPEHWHFPWVSKAASSSLSFPETKLFYWHI